MFAIEEAQKLNPRVSQESLLSLELMVRKVTNNNFHKEAFRCSSLSFEGNTLLIGQGRSDIFKPGDRVEINGSRYNDGLYTVRGTGKGSLSFDVVFINEGNGSAILTKVEYPADVIEGVKKLIAYDAKMNDKMGIKSETVARWSVTYYDLNSSESEEGYPAALLGFLQKYRKIRWS